ncbi:signal peptidase I [Cellulomonas sp. KH9]|uniref:signal peptidase I n=1 Tax=Cellulomonas sp. KH9 TaxID=1855324 RepID=UPI0008F43C46|nr:signal peptidase I [Cellulomonas sp. KH9]SFK14803.1 signal peptidase, endoplasmic reticulum-type [Cellulomonas sp. KH9]
MTTTTAPREAAPPVPAPVAPSAEAQPRSRARVVARSVGVGVSYGVLAVVLLLAAVTILVPRFTGSVPLTVLSGSMEPALPVGSLVVVRPVDPADVRIGDVVTYLPHPNDPTAITHRVTGVTHRTDGGRTFTMQGDANDAPDLPVQDHQVRARVWYVVHHLGHLNSAVNVDDRHLGVYVVAGGFFVWALDLWRRASRARTAPSDASLLDEGGAGQGAQQGPVGHP